LIIRDQTRGLPVTNTNI